MSQPPGHLSLTPGNFDHPPATNPFDPAATGLEHHNDRDVSHRLRALQRSIRGERQRARRTQELSDARRRRRALTPPTMPSGDGSPARRMRNLLRHVQSRVQDEHVADDTSTSAGWSDSLGSRPPVPDVRRSARIPASRVPRSTLRDLDDTMDVFRNLESRMQSARPGHTSIQRHRPAHAAEPASNRLDLDALNMGFNEPIHRLAQVNEDARSLLARPLPHEDLTRQRLADDSETGHRRKRRRIDSMPRPKAYYPITYGNEGQVVSGKLKMQLVSSDGGIVNSPFSSSYNRRSNAHPGPDDNEYTPTNVLRDDASVYCTRSSHCNMVFQHQGRTPFTLEKLVIKAPKVGYTDPVQEGLVFTALHQDDIFEATKRYHIWHYPTSRFGHLFKSHGSHPVRAPLGRRFTHATPPPISHVRAERQLNPNHAIDSLDSASEDDSQSDTSSTSLLPPDIMMDSTTSGYIPDESYDSELAAFDELNRRGNLAAAARHPVERSVFGLRQNYGIQASGNDMERPRPMISPTLLEQASQIDAAFERLRAMDRETIVTNRLNGTHIPTDVATVLRDFESASLQIEDLRQSLQQGNETLRNIEAGLDSRGTAPHFHHAVQAEDPRDHFHHQHGHATQRPIDAPPAQPDTPGTHAELLTPDARFSMHRHSPSRSAAATERTSWFTRSEARVAQPTPPTSQDKFRPRSVDLVDEHLSRPTEGLGSVLKSELASDGARVDYVHVRTTQIVQKDNEMIISFDPPISAKLILLKLWNPKACGDVDGKHNIDIESIQAIGWAGPRWFPAVGLR